MSLVSMPRTRISPLLLVAAAALLSAGLALVSCQQQQNVAPSTGGADKSAPSSFAVPSPTEAGLGSLQDQLGQAQKQQQQQQDGKQDRAIWPVVDIDNQANKSTLDVHVPIFFDMLNHNDKEAGKSRLDLSVLQGLVTVNKDKARDQNGVMSGPVKVTVFGIPVYTSKGSPAMSRAAAAHRELDNSIETARSAASAKANEMGTAMTEKAQRTNEKMLGSVSDIFERFTSMMRRSNSPASLAVSPGPGPSSGSGSSDSRGSNSSSSGQNVEQQQRRELDRNDPIRSSGGGGQQRDPRAASRQV